MGLVRIDAPAIPRFVCRDAPAIYLWFMHLLKLTIYPGLCDAPAMRCCFTHLLNLTAYPVCAMHLLNISV